MFGGVGALTEDENISPVSVESVAGGAVDGGIGVVGVGDGIRGGASFNSDVTPSSFGAVTGVLFGFFFS